MGDPACASKPITSLCLLQRIGFVDDLPDFQDNVHVSMVGSWQPLRTFDNGIVGTTTVFVPCQAKSLP